MNLRLLISALFVIILLAGGLYLIIDARPDETDPWRAIPEDAAVILEIDRPHDLISKLSADNELWEGVRNNTPTAMIPELVYHIDSIRNSAAGEEGPDEHPLVICLSPSYESSSFRTLVISAGHASGDLTRMISILTKDDQYASEKLSDNIYRLTRNQEPCCYLTFSGSLIAAAGNIEALKAFHRDLARKGTPLAGNARVEKLRAYAGANVDARLYIHYNNFSNVLSELAEKKYRQRLSWLSHFAGWTETDIILKKDELLLTGFTTPDTSQNELLAFFRDSKAVEHKIFNVLPFNTKILLCLGKDDFAGYPAPDNLATLSAQAGTDLGEIYGMIHGEIALAGSASNPGSLSSNSWFYAGTDDTDRLSIFLNGLSAQSASMRVSGHESYQIGKIDIKGLIPGIFGNAFDIITENYYTFIDDFAVFANTRESLVNLIRMYETGKTLDLNENFRTQSDNIGESSNILLYVKPLELTSFFPHYLDKDHRDLATENTRLLRSLLGLSFQFNGGDDLYYTSFYLKGSKSYKEENLAIWKTVLDDDIVGQPTLVLDHNSKNYNMVVFDQSKNMYLVSTNGQRLWKKRIDALPESRIFEVDYYKNGKIQYLFNTRDFVYLVDRNGENVADYPRKLSPSATNGLSLFDYNNKRDYRMIIALADKRIYNYTLKGSEVKGWAKPRTKDIVLDPVQRLVADGKDYIVINDANNDLTIVNRRGNVRIKLKQDPERAKYSDFYVNQTNSKGILLSTDVRGKLFYIARNGSLDYTDFGDFSPSHFFLYEDFNGDGNIDFIYLDGNDLTVFDRFKNVLFTYQFESPISIRPEFFRLSGTTRVLGVVADREKTVYLFDNKGNTLISKGLVGETPFTVGSLQNNNDLNLVTASGSTLFNYRID